MVPMTGNKLSLNPKLAEHRPESYIAMGHTAERVASRFGITREMQDAFAVRSHEKAIAAIDAGRFKDEIVPVAARIFENGAVKEVPFEVDEFPRRGTNMEALAKLKPVFATKGTVTAGNSSPLSDGAAAAVPVSDAKLRELGVAPIARFRAFAVRGVPPDIMGIGPCRRPPPRQDRLASDIDLFELNEAFASQAVYVQRALEIPDEKLNVNGGAIALGHPLGCTGAKLSATALYELRRRKGRYAIVTMCIGGGMGAAGLRGHLDATMALDKNASRFSAPATWAERPRSYLGTVQRSPATS